MIAARAWIGAVRAAPLGFGAGIGIALIGGLPIFHVSGAGVILAMTIGALAGLVRR
ncbi:MAG: hypothetical protein ACKV2T_36855 [Kofleriaceae bacterium]